MKPPPLQPASQFKDLFAEEGEFDSIQYDPVEQALEAKVGERMHFLFQNDLGFSKEDLIEESNESSHIDSHSESAPTFEQQY